MLSDKDDQTVVAVLGGGLAGLAAAQKLREQGYHADLYEKNSHVGGLACSEEVKGFIFDLGPHISFTKRPEIQEFFANAVGQEYRTVPAKIYNYWQGHLIRHPVQCNLHDLPVEVVLRCTMDFIRAKCQENGQPIRTYADWCYKSLGRAFSEEFTFRYTRKYWTSEAKNMSADWVGPRVYSPTIEQVLRGALGTQEKNYHYFSDFRYPERGGFASYLAAFAPSTNDYLEYELVEVDLKRQRLDFSNGRSGYFDLLVSSIPVPELIRCIKDAPAAVTEAAEQLVCTSTTLVNIGVDRNEGFGEGCVLYVYDEDIPFARVNFPHRLSPANVPAGCGSIQAEVYHSRYKLPGEGNILDASIEGLQRIGLLDKSDRIIVAQTREVPYANVLFDLNRAANLAVVQSYLAQNNILCCGRFGNWAYYWTDDCIVSAWRVAQAVGRLARQSCSGKV